MASVQDEYIHPVIAAMQNAYQIIEHGKQQKFQNELDQKESDLKQASFQEAQKQHDREQSNADRQFSINQALLEIQRQQHALDSTKAVQELLKTGVKPVADTTTIPTAPEGSGVPGIDVQRTDSAHLPGNLPGLEGFHFDPRAFQSQDEAQQNAIDFGNRQVAGQTTAQQTALQPFLDAQHKQARQDKIDEIAATGANTERVAKINHQNDIDLANIRGWYQLQSQRIAHAQGQSENAPLIANALDGIMNGQTQYSTLPKDIKEGVTALAGTKGWQIPTDRKTYADKLETVTSIQNLMDQYRDLAINHSRDSAGSNLLGVVSGSPNIPFTDMKSKIDALKSTGGTAASFFDKQNRKTDSEILRAVAGLFDPRATKAQNLDKLDQHSGLINNAIKGIFAGFTPDQINYVMSSRGASDFGGFESPKSKDVPNWLSIAPKKNTKGTPLDQEESIKQGHPVYGR